MSYFWCINSNVLCALLANQNATQTSHSDKIKQHLTFVTDDDFSEEIRKVNRFWEVGPFTNHIWKGCLLQAWPEWVSIDEQMIPFTGASQFRQYVPLEALSSRHENVYTHTHIQYIQHLHCFHICTAIFLLWWKTCFCWNEQFTTLCGFLVCYVVKQI